MTKGHGYNGFITSIQGLPTQVRRGGFGGHAIARPKKEKGKLKRSYYRSSHFSKDSDLYFIRYVYPNSE